MSLVPSFIKADDNKYYKNPVLAGDDFFICFDDDDPPELVVKVNGRTEEQLKARVDELLKEFNSQICGKPVMGAGRIFSEDMSGFEFEAAYSVFIDIKQRIPHEKITTHDGVFDDPEGECVFMAFEEDS